jgi:hypothetical protein
MIVTATLTTQVGRVARGIIECTQLVDEILNIEHVEWETLLVIGDAEFYKDPDAEYPNQQMRVSASPENRVAALSYTDHDNPITPIVHSYNPDRPYYATDLIFNGTTGAIFPRSAVISIGHARLALKEWIKTRQRPECIDWQTPDDY